MPNKPNVTIDGPTASDVEAIAGEGRIEVYNEDGPVRAVVTKQGYVHVENYGGPGYNGTVQVETGDGRAKVINCGASIKVKTETGRIDVDAWIHPDYYDSLDVNIDRQAGRCEVKIDCLIPYHQVFVDIGEFWFYKTITGRKISLEITEEELVLNGETSEVKPSS